MKGGETPVSWKQAIISMKDMIACYHIREGYDSFPPPKEGKDRSECTSYRPISVLNIDYRIFTSIIAKRLENVIPDLIDHDQTGFIKYRQTQDNVRRALYLIHIMSQNQFESVAMSLDAEKAFDMVQWEFLYLVLKQFGFKEQIIGCLKSLYSCPTAWIKMNGNLSRTITLERGCRQGCPLNPTLFALFIEPLAQCISEDQKIKGIQVKGVECKICLYADDILLT